MADTVLYIGGFELPDRNAAAQRVVGIAKAIRELGYNVVFLNALKSCDHEQEKKCEYFGFECYEYHREGQLSYLFTGEKAISYIERMQPKYVIAYNYPAFALARIVRHCKSNGIKCISDVTEWYEPDGNLVHKSIKKLDVDYRMYRVLYKMDGIIAISRFLYDLYSEKVKTVLIPPTVDIAEPKWACPDVQHDDVTTFIYAGTPSAQKEKLDITVDAVVAASQRYPVKLHVVGITKEQYQQMYQIQEDPPTCITFWGRIPHGDVIRLTTEADWTIIIRENSRLVRAGFPTKLVESISCGTPVIVNQFSNICDYLDDTNSLIVDEVSSVKEVIMKACVTRLSPCKKQFDYQNFSEELSLMFPAITEY